jgi:large subunit ribosomal protein L25
VTTEVTVELKGTAVGTTQGGVVQFVTHELEIECPAMSIPEKIVLNVNDLALGKAIHAHEVPLPDGVVLTSAPDVIVVQCVTPHVEEIPVPGAGGTAEPEVIGGKKPGEEEAEGGEKKAAEKK